ncbi:UDP-glucose:glycoprotein glucosyltransferase 1-like isoform X2 [Babylonia areolata]|uniref:UDP-glucose:glycoprotein glucosyltransferase 1-like isoform X2 n=1 Tax=Babylonia areolata TaxID=304850 RepID=UPI003FD332D8
MKVQCVLVLVCLAFHCYTEGKKKPVTVRLDAKWHSTPLLCEVSEYLAQESNDFFWSFVRDLSRSQNLDHETDKSIYSLGLSLASKLVSPLQLNLLKLTLSLRAFSPAVQTHQQIAQEIPKSKECTAFIEVKGQVTCDPNELGSLLAGDGPSSTVYQFDHVYPGAPDSKPVVILYAELGTPQFVQFHGALAEKAAQREIQYVLRHFIQDPSQKRLRLSGYGVELAIKSTEYKAKDDTKVEGEAEGDSGDWEEEGEELQGFVFSRLRELHPELDKELKEFRSHLLQSVTELAPLKAWQMQDLSLQAAQQVLNVAPGNALQVLTDISQNFPTVARSLIRTSVASTLRKEVKQNQALFEHHHQLGPGESALFLNGRSVEMEIYDTFTLLDIMGQEAKLVEGLYSLGFKKESLQQLLQLDLSGGDDSSYAVDIRHSAVQYLNDLEKDRKYRGWPSSVQDLLRPTFPGMLRHVAKNIFHMVFAVNPAEDSSRELLKMAEAFYVHSAPIRLGVVMAVNGDSMVTGRQDAGVAFARTFDFIKADQSTAKALSFITDVYEKVGSREITAEAIVAEFGAQYPGEDLDLVFGKNSDYDDTRRAGADFVGRSGLSGFPHVLINGVPLDRKFLSQDAFEEGVVTEILRQTPLVQKAVFNGELTDRMDVLDWLMEQDNVMPRLNSRVLSPPTSHLDLTENMDGQSVDDPDTFALLSSREISAAVADRMKYLTKRDEEAVRAVSLWVVCDLETPEGRDLMYSAIKHAKASSDLRLGIVFNSASPGNKNLVSRAMQVALQTLPNTLAKSFVTKLVKEDNYADLMDGKKTLSDLEVNGMDMASFLRDLEREKGGFLQSHAVFASRVLGFTAGQRGMVVNGKVYGPLEAEETFTQDDFGLLEKLVSVQSGIKLKHQVQGLQLPGSRGSDMVMKVSALLSTQASTVTRHKVAFKGDTYSVVKIPAAEDSPAFTVEAIVDPASREAQKLAPILQILQSVANVDIRVFMNCREQLSDMPVKRFYRYVVEPELAFRSDGEVTEGPVARFLDLPQKSLLTLGMEPPESWLVESVSSVYDLDNILLEEVEKSINAGFELEYLLLEGHCYDSTTMQPPRGLQFILGTPSRPAIVDTIVMANLGYFQLKASPGLWQLRLREGRSQDIYDIQSHERTDTPVNSSEVIVAMTSFKSKIIRIKVAKKPEKKSEKLLQDDSEESQGLWNSISSSFSGQKGEEDKDNTLNIFSLASGHLYERFLRIMMLSVLKNTQSKVKFWFLKNYLSPTFKDFIPHMAKQYGFEYELVQYKWPRWLNQQKEKQRIIWGYKILFLDVLFPLDVKKIIFVDADQIVRADLQELHDLNLGGAPYGYTPFCDSRKEMDGFRFWKSGYWHSHLAGRKYHISALYVVDLKKFRHIAAGDRLRGQYQGLSQDPNSLANLDQDLPNNMIHQVAIKSLPQEWLYCETWCSTEEKSKAKTIDLCNNPLTKEPKLQAAMRIVPEWKDYDYEIKVLWDQIYRTNTKDQIEYERPDIPLPDFKVKTEL